MTNQQPDKFFREKLVDHHKPAPAGAWDRIEASLKKTEPKFAWWKVAASVLLLSVIGYVIWFQTSRVDHQAISQNQPDVESPVIKSEDTEIDTSEKHENQDEDKNKKSSAAVNPMSKKSIAKKEAAQPTTHPKKKTSSVAVEIPSSAVEITPPAETPPLETVSDNVASTDASTNASSITMTITVEETNKYLDKNSLAEATSKERKSSTFKKLLKKANELTTNQDPFGDLRVKKNEILALDFKNDKRGQNK